MRIFVAGASGALGRQLQPMLVSAGHAVWGLTRTAGKASVIRATGAEPVVADALDRRAMMALVAHVAPDVVVHELTALSSFANLRRFDRGFAETNRLRTEGTRILIEAACMAGARRFVAQSFAGWPYARIGGPVKTEEDPLDPNPPRPARHTLAAIRELEALTTGAADLEGVVLRYGAFYGPGTSLGEGSRQLTLVRRRLLPVFGDGGGIWSFIHIEDAAAATHAAIERAAPGIYNIVDDDPAPVAEWLPALAAAIGAKPPYRVPAWLGRLVIGEQGMAMMTRSRGASNAKAKRELGWPPRFPSWREGFRNGLGGEYARRRR
ncbi:MAG: NAD(P)-dependent oxidoreductase [Acetobacteraceae bacterium]|nr:NAD(P)-dependent oxidoreductase [Acetobacteraceae bacterium]